MEPNLRKDAFFVQDELWYKQSEKYENFIEENKEKNVVLLEFGVGFNTPGIIRFPFEQLVSQNKNWKLIRFNKECKSFLPLGEKLIEVTEDINEIFKE